MLKNLLIECSELFNRSDIANELKKHSSASEITDPSLQNDTLRLISFYNYVTSSLFNNYVELIVSEQIKTDEKGNVYFSMLSELPCKLLRVENESKSIKFSIYPNSLKTNLSNTNLKITYRYIPKEARDLNSKLFTSNRSILNVICYGVVSEFLASKNLFDESDFWKNKFLFEAFNLKSKRGRHIKPTFTI